MSKYIETINKSKIDEIQESVNVHLIDSIGCDEVVETVKHITEDKYIFNYDRFLDAVGATYKTERQQYLDNFVSNNNDVAFVEYSNLIDTGYEKEEEE